MSSGEFNSNSRLSEAEKLLSKYTDRRPIIINNKISNNELKYIVPINLTIIQLLYIIKKKEGLNENEAFYLFTEDKSLVTSSSTIGQIYGNYKNKDNFLYLDLHKESVFG